MRTRRASPAKPTAPVLVEAKTALRGNDLHFLAERENQFLAEIEAAASPRVGLLVALGEESEGMRKIPETVWIVILDAQLGDPGPISLRQGHVNPSDVLVPGILDQLV